MELSPGLPHGEERASKKDVIFEQAMRVFAQKGFERTTIDDIAEQAGIAKGTIYYHFKGKNELFAFLLQESGMVLIRQMDHELALGGSVRERLERIIDAHLVFFQDYQDFCTILFSELMGPATRWREEMDVLRESYVSRLTNLIREGQSNGELLPVSPKTTAQVFFGTISTVALGRILGGQRFDAETVADEVRQLLFGGILAGPRYTPVDM